MVSSGNASFSSSSSLHQGEHASSSSSGTSEGGGIGEGKAKKVIRSPNWSDMVTERNHNRRSSRSTPLVHLSYPPKIREEGHPQQQEEERCQKKFMEKDRRELCRASPMLLRLLQHTSLLGMDVSEMITWFHDAVAWVTEIQERYEKQDEQEEKVTNAQPAVTTSYTSLLPSGVGGSGGRRGAVRRVKQEKGNICRDRRWLRGSGRRRGEAVMGQQQQTGSCNTLTQIDFSLLTVLRTIPWWRILEVEEEVEVEGGEYYYPYSSWLTQWPSPLAGERGVVGEEDEEGMYDDGHEDNEVVMIKDGQEDVSYLLRHRHDSSSSSFSSSSSSGSEDEDKEEEEEQEEGSRPESPPHCTSSSTRGRKRQRRRAECVNSSFPGKEGRRNCCPISNHDYHDPHNYDKIKKRSWWREIADSGLYSSFSSPSTCSFNRVGQSIETDHHNHENGNEDGYAAQRALEQLCLLSVSHSVHAMMETIDLLISPLHHRWLLQSKNISSTSSSSSFSVAPSSPSSLCGPTSSSLSSLSTAFSFSSPRVFIPVDSILRVLNHVAKHAAEASSCVGSRNSTCSGNSLPTSVSASANARVKKGRKGFSSSSSLSYTPVAAVGENSRSVRLVEEIVQHGIHQWLPQGRAPGVWQHVVGECIFLYWALEHTIPDPLDGEKREEEEEKNIYAYPHDCDCHSENQTDSEKSKGEEEVAVVDEDREEVQKEEEEEGGEAVLVVASAREKVIRRKRRRDEKEVVENGAWNAATSSAPSASSFRYLLKLKKNQSALMEMFESVRDLFQFGATSTKHRKYTQINKKKESSCCCSSLTIDTCPLHANEDLCSIKVKEEKEREKIIGRTRKRKNGEDGKERRGRAINYLKCTSGADQILSLLMERIQLLELSLETVSFSFSSPLSSPTSSFPAAEVSACFSPSFPPIARTSSTTTASTTRTAAVLPPSRSPPSSSPRLLPSFSIPLEKISDHVINDHEMMKGTTREDKQTVCPAPASAPSRRSPRPSPLSLPSRVGEGESKEEEKKQEEEKKEKLEKGPAVGLEEEEEWCPLFSFFPPFPHNEDHCNEEDMYSSSSSERRTLLPTTTTTLKECIASTTMRCAIACPLTQWWCLRTTCPFSVSSIPPTTTSTSSSLGDGDGTDADEGGDVTSSSLLVSLPHIPWRCRHFISSKTPFFLSPPHRWASPLTRGTSTIPAAWRAFYSPSSQPTLNIIESSTVLLYARLAEDMRRCIQAHEDEIIQQEIRLLLVENFEEEKEEERNSPSTSRTATPRHRGGHSNSRTPPPPPPFPSWWPRLVQFHFNLIRRAGNGPVCLAYMMPSLLHFVYNPLPFAFPHDYGSPHDEVKNIYDTCRWSGGGAFERRRTGWNDHPSNPNPSGMFSSPPPLPFSSPVLTKKGKEDKESSRERRELRKYLSYFYAEQQQQRQERQQREEEDLLNTPQREHRKVRTTLMGIRRSEEKMIHSKIKKIIQRVQRGLYLQRHKKAEEEALHIVHRLLTLVLKGFDSSGAVLPDIPNSTSSTFSSAPPPPPSSISSSGSGGPASFHDLHYPHRSGHLNHSSSSSSGSASFPHLPSSSSFLWLGNSTVQRIPTVDRIRLAYYIFPLFQWFDLHWVHQRQDRIRRGVPVVEEEDEKGEKAKPATNEVNEDRACPQTSLNDDTSSRRTGTFEVVVEVGEAPSPDGPLSSDPRTLPMIPPTGKLDKEGGEDINMDNELQQEEEKKMKRRRDKDEEVAAGPLSEEETSTTSTSSFLVEKESIVGSKTVAEVLLKRLVKWCRQHPPPPPPSPLPLAVATASSSSPVAFSSSTSSSFPCNHPRMRTPSLTFPEKTEVLKLKEEESEGKGLKGGKKEEEEVKPYRRLSLPYLTLTATSPTTAGGYHYPPLPPQHHPDSLSMVIWAQVVAIAALMDNTAQVILHKKKKKMKKKEREEQEQEDEKESKNPTFSSPPLDSPYPPHHKSKPSSFVSTSSSSDYSHGGTSTSTVSATSWLMLPALWKDHSFLPLLSYYQYHMPDSCYINNRNSKNMGRKNNREEDSFSMLKVEQNNENEEEREQQQRSSTTTMKGMMTITPSTPSITVPPPPLDFYRIEEDGLLRCMLLAACPWPLRPCD